MPGIEDWINCPLNIIQNIFEQCPEDAAHTEKVKEYFTKRTAESKTLSWIPSLNDTPLHNLKTDRLVQFRCMVQDMRDPEFYLGVYEVEDKKSGAVSQRSGKYRDIASCAAHQEILVDSTRNVTMDRQTFYCIPVPAETTWVKQGYASQCSVATPSTSTQPNRSKRSLDDEEEEDTGMETQEADRNGVMDSIPVSNGEGDPAHTEAKKTRTDAPTDSSRNQIPDLNFPLPDEKGPACLVKIYDNMEAYKLNEVYHFFGILSNNPAMVSFPDDNMESAIVDGGEAMESVEEHNVHSPPPSLVPRLHVLVSHKLQHNHPSLPRQIDFSSPDFTAIISEAEQVRTELLGLLQTMLFGDGLAAEYMLCYLLSNVYTRHDEVVAVGKFAMNISNCPRTSQFPTLFQRILQDVVTKCHFISLSLSNLNSLRYVPVKDYSTNRLVSGILQLSEHTHLILDETAMEAGQLDTNGVKNLTALGNMVTWQKVEYDFNFHKQAFTTNVPVLIFSEGKSLIKSDCQVPLKHECTVQQLEQKYQEIKEKLTPAICNKFSTYLTVLRLLPYSLPEDVQEAVEADFVSARKDNAKNMTIDDFHNLLSVARLLSLSRGKANLTTEVWERTKQMEQARKARLPTPAAS